MSKILLVQGCFDILHSYSLVLQAQLPHIQAWCRDNNWRIVYQRLPYPSPQWTKESNLKEPCEDLWDGRSVDIVYRISFPYDVSPAPNTNAHVFLFMTFESQAIDPASVVGGESALKEALRAGYLSVVTPSQFSAAALPPGTCHIVPHGIDPVVFRPQLLLERPIVGSQEGEDDTFVFLSVGAMTDNKGMLGLLQSFIQVHQRGSVKLVLKGLSKLYNSKQRFLQVVDKLSPHIIPCLKDIVFVDDSLSPEQMALLYNSADCYVAPYLSEAFCLPALEAASCGLPCIVTDHGPTSEFLARDVHVFIRTYVRGSFLEPDLTDLVACMRKVMQSPRMAKKAWKESLRLHKIYSWEAVTRQQCALFNDRVLEVL